MLSSNKLAEVPQTLESSKKAAVFMRSLTTHKMWAVKKLDQNVAELSSHDGCFYHFLNYSFWPSGDADISYSTSQLSESRFSHHVCHVVVNTHRRVVKNDFCQGKCWQNPVTRCHIDIIGHVMLAARISVSPKAVLQQTGVCFSPWKNESGDVCIKHFWVWVSLSLLTFSV